MWSTADVMNELRNHRQTCAKIAIIENTLKQAESARCQYNIHTLEMQRQALNDQKRAVESWLQILPIEERFLVATHLIQGLDWAKTIVEHEKMWGVMNGRSERTLKHIQSKAVDRIVACLNQIESLSQSETKEVK